MEIDDKATRQINIRGCQVAVKPVSGVESMGFQRRTQHEDREGRSEREDERRGNI
jgi:hypothetical protein